MERGKEERIENCLNGLVAYFILYIYFFSSHGTTDG